jgi:hypothetical protein
MKNQLLILIMTFSSITYGQRPAKELVFEKFFIASQSSRIEINPNKDTVMISEYYNPNTRTNAPSRVEVIYKGTPLLNNVWEMGTVKIAKGSSRGTMAYNLEKQLVYFMQKDGQNSIEIRPDEFEFRGYNFKRYDKEITAAGDDYYIKLFDGEIELFKKFSCIYRPSVIGEKNGYEQSGQGFEGEFVKKTEYYTVFHGKMQLINKRFKVFDKKEDQAKAYAKENKLSLQKEADLIKIVNYLNTKI